MTTTLMMASSDLPSRSVSGFLWRHIAPRVEPFQLYGPLARRLPFSLTAPFSDIIIGTGHGEPDQYTAQSESLIWKMGTVSPREVRGKVVKLISCHVGAGLGQDLVNTGQARCFLGYDDEVIWILDTAYARHPWDDPFARLCLMPIVNSVHALLDGATCEEAFQIEYTGYIENIALTDSPMVQSCLEFNAKHAMLFGDPEARIRRRPRISLPPPPPLLI